MERSIAPEAGKVIVVVIRTLWICFYEALNYLLSNVTDIIMLVQCRKSVKAHNNVILNCEFISAVRAKHVYALGNASVIGIVRRQTSLRSSIFVLQR